MMLQAYDTIPNLNALDQQGQRVSLHDFAGRKLVLYFYPKDNTPGCTVEAKEFSELQPAFTKKNAVIVGVSRDSVASHDSFVCKHELALTLLSDTDGSLCETFGAWREKKKFGKTYMGIVRSTWLIDENSRVVRTWDTVTARGHAQEVLESLG